MLKENICRYCNKEGKNCSQIILLAADEEYGFSLPKEVLNACRGISGGFGIQGMCSGLVAAVMVLGFLSVCKHHILSKTAMHKYRLYYYSTKKSIVQGRNRGAEHFRQGGLKLFTFSVRDKRKTARKGVPLFGYEGKCGAHWPYFLSSRAQEGWNGADTEAEALQHPGIATAQKTKAYDENPFTYVNDHDPSTSAPSCLMSAKNPG